MVVDFKTKIIKGLFVKVPDGLKHWKINIPKGNKYKILGFSHKLKEYEVEKVLRMSMNEYFKLLTDKNITVNYSKNTGQWIVLVTC